MIKVITYGTYDLLHHGHIRLLQRAKALGDYLIVGVTSDTFDRERGKINVQQSLMERVEAVKATGIADEIIIEEYEGQKIDDIKRLNVDIFTVGSDWRGKFDYLKAYCRVVYLERTSGVSSTEIRSEQQPVTLGLVGESPILNKIERESRFVNGLEIGHVFSINNKYLSNTLQAADRQAASFEDLLNSSDALYIISAPEHHYDQIKQAIERGKHVLCESPMALQTRQWKELHALAAEKGVVLMDGIKTAYSTAYYRLLLLAKGGIIGDIVSVDATCTSLQNFEDPDPTQDTQRSLFEWNSICALAALMSRTCACSISDPMALTKASKLLFSILLSLLLIVVCIESYKGKPNYRFSMKLADCFYSWLNLFIALAFTSSAMSM